MENLSDLNKPGRKFLKKIVLLKTLKNKDKVSWSDLYHSDSIAGEGMKAQDISRGYKELERRGLVSKPEKGQYKIKEGLKRETINYAEKQKGKTMIQSYDNDKIISFSTNNPRSSTLILGLPMNVFDKRGEKGYTSELSKEETYEFRQGIEAKQLMGRYFGLPQHGVEEAPAMSLSIKRFYRENKDELSEEEIEEEIINREVEHYKEFFEEGNSFEKIVRYIIKRHRNDKIEFEEIGKNVLKGLRSHFNPYKDKKLKETYDNLLESKEISKDVKQVLEEFKEELLGIVTQMGVNDVSLFVSFGFGSGAFPGKIPASEEVKERHKKFKNAMLDLYPEDVSKDDICPISVSEDIPEKYLSEEQIELKEFLSELFEENRKLFTPLSFFTTEATGLIMKKEFVPINDKQMEEYIERLKEKEED